MNASERRARSTPYHGISRWHVISRRHDSLQSVCSLNFQFSIFGVEQPQPTHVLEVQGLPNEKNKQYRSPPLQDPTCTDCECLGKADKKDTTPWHRQVVQYQQTAGQRTVVFANFQLSMWNNLNQTCGRYTIVCMSRGSDEQVILVSSAPRSDVH